MQRNNDGMYELDKLSIIPRDTVGRKQKIWLRDGNDEFLFKTGSSNYEIYAEMIFSEIAMQCNMASAHYDIAIYNGYVGVVTPSFLREGDIIVSGEDLCMCAKILSPEFKFTNSIDNIYDMMKILTNRDYDIENLRIELLKTWLFDGLICESDRNYSNWSIIVNGDKIRVAPIYDSSTMCMLNNNIYTIINSVKNEHEIDLLINSIKFQLRRKQTDKDNDFLNSFSELCYEEPELVEQFINCLDNVDCMKAIKNIEDRINLKDEAKFRIPWECGFWINKVLSMRIDSLKRIYIKSKEKNSSIEKILKI